MVELRCRFCGGHLYETDKADVYICDSCGTPTVRKSLADEVTENIRKEADKLFLQCDFDRAMSLYKKIVPQKQTDAELYWQMALCTYGILFEDDITTGKMLPTCNRTIFDSILNDANYLSAIKYAEPDVAKSYKQLAATIDEIQKNIIKITKSIKPFDIFISYKQTEINGSATQESYFAQDIYYKLRNEGYNVFYAPITLQKVAGSDYEPYIFAALNTAKLMLVIGYSKEHFEAVWVKNEWSRFLLRKANEPNLIIMPCYNSYLMKASDIPSELIFKIQARDLKNSSANDLVAEIKQKVKSSARQADANHSESALVKQSFEFLRTLQWEKADKYLSDAQISTPDSSKVYVGQLMAKYHIAREEDLGNLDVRLEDDPLMMKALELADDEYKDVLKGYISMTSSASGRIAERYKNLCALEENLTVMRFSRRRMKEKIDSLALPRKYVMPIKPTEKKPTDKDIDLSNVHYPDLDILIFAACIIVELCVLGFLGHLIFDFSFGAALLVAVILTVISLFTTLFPIAYIIDDLISNKIMKSITKQEYERQYYELTVKYKQQYDEDMVKYEEQLNEYNNGVTNEDDRLKREKELKDSLQEAYEYLDKAVLSAQQDIDERYMSYSIEEKYSYYLYDLLVSKNINQGKKIISTGDRQMYSSIDDYFTQTGISITDIENFQTFVLSPELCKHVEGTDFAPDIRSRALNEDAINSCDTEFIKKWSDDNLAKYLELSKAK